MGLAEAIRKFKESLAALKKRDVNKYNTFVDSLASAKNDVDANTVIKAWFGFTLPLSGDKYKAEEQKNPYALSELAGLKQRDPKKYEDFLPSIGRKMSRKNRRINFLKWFGLPFSYNEAESGNLWDKLKTAVDNLATKPLETIKNAAQWALLLPFKATMFSALKSKGITPKSTEIEDVAQSFYNTFIKKGQNYEVKNLDPVLVTTIVTAVINFIKNLKAKKEAGETLSETENAILKNAEMAADTVTGAAVDEAKFQIGDFFVKYWWVIALAIGGYLYLKKR